MKKFKISTIGNKIKKESDKILYCVLFFILNLFYLLGVYSILWAFLTMFLNVELSNIPTIFIFITTSIFETILVYSLEKNMLWRK